MITIHCGLHKTGSSSIQLALDLCTKRGRAIVTPKPGDDRSEDGWRERLKKVSKTQDAVFSDENLLGSPYDGYQLAPERVAMLGEALHGSRYQIVVYLRPHVDWLPSVYLQGVQEGRTTGPESFWTSIKDEPYLRWSNLLHLVGSDSGAEQVVARAHTRSRDAVADCFELVGLGKPPRTGPNMIRENASIAAAQAPLLRELNDLPGVDDAQRKLFRTVFQRDLGLGADKTQSPFPLAIQSEISAYLRSDWSALIATPYAAEDVHVFQEALGRYDVATAPYAGGSFEDLSIQHEAMRSLRVLSLSNSVQRQSTLRKIMKKSRQDPLGLHNAVIRRLRR
jgi:hypothetical protein